MAKYPYRCESCDAVLPMTRAEFKAAGNKARCPHHSRNRPKATARGIVGNHRTAHNLTCDGCGRHVTNIIQCYRLEGPAWTERRSRRCADSRCRDGWAPVSFERTGTTFRAMEIP